jgi:hypothetical protein
MKAPTHMNTEREGPRTAENRSEESVDREEVHRGFDQFRRCEKLRELAQLVVFESAVERLNSHDSLPYPMGNSTRRSVSGETADESWLPESGRGGSGFT